MEEEESADVAPNAAGEDDDEDSDPEEAEIWKVSAAQPYAPARSLGPEHIS